MVVFLLIVILYLLLISHFYGQNIDLYLSLIDEGKTEGVMETLPELISKYPNDPGVIYIKALMTEDGKLLQFDGKLPQLPVKERDAQFTDGEEKAE